MSDPGHAQLAQKNRHVGYYVVQPVTGLAIAGPMVESAAIRECDWQNSQPDAPPDRFEVWRLTESGAWQR